MYTSENFNVAVDILHRSMDVSMLRQDVIANNIANVDTPNFKRSVVNFETQLSQALSSDKRVAFTASRTHQAHFEFDRPISYRDVHPRRVLDFSTTAKNNNNNVDIEVETANFLNNQNLYSLMSASLNTMYSRARVVLT